MKIGVDLDGTLTNFKSYKGRVNLPWWTGIWLFLLKPNKKMVEILKKWEGQGHEIIIISGRPQRLEDSTKRWLKKYQIPFKRVILVELGDGIEKRKLRVIRQLGIEMFVDDDLWTVKFLVQNGIKAKIGASL